MPRKFSIDIPKLKMVSRKPTRDQNDSYPESPPPPAKSVRPALPEDVEAALRSICTKIFNETNATSLPDTDHDLLRAFWQQGAEDDQQAVVQKVQHVQLSSHIVQQVASAVPKRQDSLTHRTESPAREARAKTHLTASLPKSIQRTRPAFGPRGDSIDTVASVSQSELTDEASTAMTSAFITPSRGSKRGSSQAAASEEDGKRAHTTKRDSKQSGQGRPSTSPDAVAGAAAPEQIRDPSRSRGFFHGFMHHRHTDSRPATGTEAKRERAGTMESMADSRGRTSLRSRAASSARSLSRGVKEYLRPSSRRETGEDATIAMHNAYAAMDAARPETSSSGMRKPSMEFFRRGRRSSRDDREQDSKTSPKPFRQLNATVANYKPSPMEANKIDLNRALPPLPALDLWQDAPVLLDDDEDTTAGAERPLELPKTPISPLPLMCATAFPGDFDVYAPMRTPSPISASSIRDVNQQLQSRAGSIALSCLSDAELESPKFAMMVGNRSVPDLKPHLVMNRRLSNASRPDLPDEDDEVPALPDKTEAHHHEELAGRASMDDSIGARPVVMLRKKTRKSWWKSKPRKQDWMSDVENSGSKSGMLVLSEPAAAPVIKYAS